MGTIRMHFPQCGAMWYGTMVPWYHTTVTLSHGAVVYWLLGVMVARYYGTILDHFSTMVAWCNYSTVLWLNGTTARCHHGTLLSWYHATVLSRLHDTIVPCPLTRRDRAEESRSCLPCQTLARYLRQHRDLRCSHASFASLIGLP